MLNDVVKVINNQVYLVKIMKLYLARQYALEGQQEMILVFGSPE
jgi:hypothetical protein